MMESEPVPKSGVTVGRVDNDQDTQERVLREHLEWLKRQFQVKCWEYRKLSPLLEKVREEGQAVARRAYGVLLSLGMTEHEATKEVEQWRASATSQS